MPGVSRGRFMDGQSAVEHAVLVTLEDRFLVVSAEDSGVIARFSVADLTVSAMGEGSVLHIEPRGGSGQLLTVQDQNFLRDLQAVGVRPKTTAFGQRAVVVGLVCFAAFAAFMGALHYLGPRLAEHLARRIPVSVERTLAPRTLGLLERSVCRTEKADVAVRDLVKRLAPELASAVDVRVVNLPFANAFALPGNVVILTRGLLQDAESAEEIAGVLAHELAHVKHRHVLSHLIQNTLFGGIWMVTVGDYSGVLVVDPRTAYQVALLRYSREAEAEADATALEDLSRSRISTAGLVAFFQRTEKAGVSQGPTFLASHPATTDRIQMLSAQKGFEPGPPALSADALYELRKACETAKPPGTFRDLFQSEE